MSTYWKRFKDRNRIVECCQKGSMTVEAAVIIPLIVIITGALLTLTFYQHNCCWYTNAALECAIVGNARFTGGDKNQISLEQGKKMAEERAAERVSDQTMPGTSPSFSVDSGRKETSVHYSEQEYSMFGQYFNHTASDATVERIWPARQIRAARQARKMVHEFTESSP